MSQRISLKEIPIFRYMSTTRSGKIMDIFEKKHAEPGEMLVSHGKVVPGLFVVMDGFVEVLLQNSPTPIAEIERGGAFGEMSFVGGHSIEASAHVRGGPEGVKYIFCSRDSLLGVLQEDYVFAHGFYQGVSSMLAERLRSTNQRISEQISTAKNQVQDLIENVSFLSKIDKTKSSLDETGFAIVKDLMKISDDVAMAIKKHPNAVVDLSSIKQNIDKTMLVESQNFDRICQMLDQLLQHFSNLDRVLGGGNAQKIQAPRGSESTVA